MENWPLHQCAEVTPISIGYRYRYLHEIQFGWEISQRAGGADFTMNSYSVNIE
jgi:hypothetical protein